MLLRWRQYAPETHVLLQRLLGFESQERSQSQPPSTPSPTPRSATMTALQVFAMLQNQGVDARTALALIYEELYGINYFTLLTLWREFGTNYLYLLFVSNRAANRTVNPNSPRLLFAGGEPDYPGSQVLNTCNPANVGNTCGNPAYTTRGSCIRWKCCWDASTRTCYHATNNVIYLRQRCRPGFRNPPKCEDIDECLSNPCQNGGICTNLLNGYRCNCLSSIAGPNCENKCQNPPTLLNGGYTPIRTPPIYDINEIITYTCNGNYALQGGNTIICLSTGQFTILSATCVQGCPRPPDIPNGVITPPDAYIAVGSAVTYTCNTGYTFNPQGTYKLACPPTQIFTVPSTNTCQKNCQSAPPPSANGFAPTYNPPSTTSFPPGTTATYTCGPNYAFPLGTVATLTCSTTGTWSSATAPICAQGCPRPANILNGEITPADASIPVGGSITYTCNSGYTFNPAGQAVLTCPSTLSFVVPPGNICFKNCQAAPPEGTNGSPPGYSTTIISGSNTYSPGTNAIYSCNANFAFPSTVSNTLTCLTTGLWSPSVAPACVSGCPRPPDIPNGIIQPPDQFIAVGSTVTYSCIQGYAFNSAGTATLTCPASLSFVVPTENTCQPNCQSAPQKTANTGDPSYNNQPVVVGNLNTYLAGTTATYTCIQNHIFPTGVTGTLTCTPSGTWNPQNAPICVPVSSCTSAPSDSCCNAPVYSNNPITGSQNYVVGTTATYTCNQGSHIAGGDDFITCMSNGQWSPSTAPSCFQVCSAAPTPQTNSGGPNYSPAVITGTTTYKKGTTAVYTCSGAFAFATTESDTLTCGSVSPGAWEKTVSPTCSAVCSTAPTEMANGIPPTYAPGTIGSNNYKSGTVATYTCTPPNRFPAGTTGTLTCNAGTWNPSTSPQCSAVCSAAPTQSSNGQPPSYSSSGTTVGGITTYSSGTQAIYSCTGDFAFPASVSHTLTCNAGTWNLASAPQCTAVCSVAPSASSNGNPPTYSQAAVTISGNTKYRSQTTATYTCQNSFSFATSTSDTLTCNAGTWSPSTPPMCEAVCSAAPTPQTNSGGPNYSPAVITGTTTYKKGTTAVYTCSGAFAFATTESDTLTCGSVSPGAWEKTVSPTCTAVCSTAPTQSTNGQPPFYSPSGTTVGGITTYSSGTQAIYSCTGDFAFPASVSHTLTCNAGTWNLASAPQCTAVCSVAPSASSNGNPPTYSQAAVTISGNTKYRSQTTATYTCQSGYSLAASTSDTITCNAGTWSPSTPPMCLAVCNNAPAVPNANTVAPTYAPPAISGTTTYQSGTIGTYTCASGFDFPVGTTGVVTCGSVTAGLWNPNTAPVCTQSCDPAPSGTNTNPAIVYSTTVNLGKYKSGTTATYTCVGQTAFLPNVNNFITCNAGTWNPLTAPACETVCQAAPTQLTNGVAPTYVPSGVVISGNTRYRKSTVATYTCNTNFNFASGVPDILSCNGPAWSGTAPLCEPVCNDAPAAANSNGNAPLYAPAVVVVGSTNTYKKNTVATYTCKTNFALGAGVSETLTCGSVSDGAWEPTTAPACLAICSSAPAAANANGQQPSYSSAAIFGTSYQSGTVATYNCLTNFAIEAGLPDTLTCQSGSWNPSTAPVCVAVCSDAPPAADGNGQAPTYSTSAISGKYRSKTMATYRCNSGFAIPVGTSETSECNSGVWNPSTAPTCRSACMPAPSATGTTTGPTYNPIAVTISGNNRYRSQTIATYGCSSNTYFATGISESLTCNAGSWSSSTSPQCTAVCSAAPAQQANGQAPSYTPAGVVIGLIRYRSGTMATYTCNDNYLFATMVSDTLTCTAPSWSPASSPTCVKACVAAPGRASANGNSPQYDTPAVSLGQGLSYRSGTIATYTCNGEFALGESVSSVLTCMGSSGWSPSTAPICLAVCAEAPAAANANGMAPTYSTTAIIISTNTRYRSGTVATYRCNTGSELGVAVSETIVCTSLSWSGGAPVCLATCSAAPAALTNGNAPTYSAAPIGGNYRSGTIATYTCQTNFAFGSGGTDILTCSSGAWSPTSAPACLQTCSAAPAPANAQGNSPSYSTSAISAGSYRSATSATYTCMSSNYIIVGSNSLVCVSGSWVPAAAPVCVAACTTAPSQLTNGNAPTYSTTEIVSGRYAANTIATYTCQTGFGFNNDQITTSTIQCSSTGTWNPTTAPQCVSVCGTPLCRNGQSCVGSACLCDVNGGTFCEWKPLGGGRYYRVLSTPVTSFTDAVAAC
uniref:sushi, von Willebrand factor type A, EGF and pentraxin domain-containing protein 1-like isoform X2 n=1 Tax=Ciona intestinalis TaxID=7719 RepID=UPI000EF518B1|nr:sushi, von Willebrand factor type A, EGF and pentraxin domain-containing protein 1-like isoform X2 [Ciona intestinalis]|eukprot:XP_026690776.1 sushi, von Willebrand factor type A, EGF and pentraxin domain-containing protein 1-like isoform X2 [Ciona intestinalis]